MIRRAMLLPLLLGVLVACGRDADLDGFAAAEDCDDTDPFTYPGAPDDPADGIDSDCDGSDPEHAFTGSWSLDALSADYSSFSFLVEGSESGALSIGTDMLADAQISATLNPDITGGTAYPIDLDLVGDASPVDGPSLVEVYLSGEAYGESVTLELGCGVVEEALLCDGLMLVFQTGLLATASFSAP